MEALMQYVRLGLLLSIFLPSLAIAKVCVEEYITVTNKVDAISTLLADISNKQAYLEHVKARYDDVEAMLTLAKTCAEDASLSSSERLKWANVAGVLSTFQSSAQSSAFTYFSDWIEVKENDVSAASSFR